MGKAKLQILSLIAIFWSEIACADRFGVDEDGGYDSGATDHAGGNPLAALIAIVLSVLAYGYLFSSYQDWKNRRVGQENPPKLDGVTEWVVAVVGYLIVAVFISFPVLLVVKWVASAAVVRECWYLVYFPSFILLAYFRRT